MDPGPDRGYGPDRSSYFAVPIGSGPVRKRSFSGLVTGLRNNHPLYGHRKPLHSIDRFFDLPIHDTSDALTELKNHHAAQNETHTTPTACLPCRPTWEKRISKKLVIHASNEGPNHLCSPGFRPTPTHGFTELLVAQHGYIGIYISACDMCLRTRTQQHLPLGEPQPLPISQPHWDTISVDVMVELPESGDTTPLLQ